MSRGNGGQEIFSREEDWGSFVHILAETKRRFSFQLYAYCLMPNHFHLLIKVGATSLPVIMQTLLTWYANYFNFVRERTGHVFQSRYKAILCTDDRYLLTLIRYIHANPVHAGLVHAAGDWKWSGHQDYATGQLGLVDTRVPLSMLGDSPTDAVEPDRGILVPRSLLRVEALRPETAASAGSEEAAAATAAPLDSLAQELTADAGISIAELCGKAQTHRLASLRRIFVRRALSSGLRPHQIAGFLKRSPALITKYGAIDPKKE